ncbi:MAG: vanadium-dependent haloperoxidase, partial [Actinomycetota bacterium]
MRLVTRVLTSAVAATCLLGVPVPIAPASAATGDNAVVRWNEVAINTIVADGSRATPSASSLYVAITQIAVYDAAMAIEGTHQPYAYFATAPPGASEDAAIATAAHDVLVNYFPAQASSVDNEYASALAEIPDGPSKEDGIAVGRASAGAIIDRRANDGRDAPVPAPPDGTQPGEWRRTGPGSVVTPYVAQVTPFLAESPDQFQPKGPNPLDSHAYAADYERTRLYGAKNSSLRTPAQTEIAVFWTENTVRQYNRGLRDLATQRQLSVGDSAVLFAMTTVPGADAMITCWNTKFHFLRWRPVTAIRQGDDDGNAWTVGDPTWEPLSSTALHPEYVSGHACLTGAITRGLEEFFGTKKIDFSLTSTAVPGVTHTFATVEQLRT